MTVKDWDLEEGTDCKGIWGVMKIFDILTVVVITQLGTFVKTHQTVHLERVNFTVYKLYLNFFKDEKINISLNILKMKKVNISLLAINSVLLI